MSVRRDKGEDAGQKRKTSKKTESRSEEGRRKGEPESSQVECGNGQNPRGLGRARSIVRPLVSGPAGDPRGGERRTNKEKEVSEGNDGPKGSGHYPDWIHSAGKTRSGHACWIWRAADQPFLTTKAGGGRGTHERKKSTGVRLDKKQRPNEKKKRTVPEPEVGERVPECKEAGGDVNLGIGEKDQ